MYIVILKPRAEKQLSKLREKDRTRIKSAIDQLWENPYFGKKMDGSLAGCYSIRVWPWRIIYVIQKDIVTVTVVAIGDRKDIYKKLRG
ncbi:MAG: RelE protein [Candidatus Peregrinibacteria bacterium Greene1014_49]|nr:MAG: RelE protein [Candidatus Peregrinibacteria bacterium Greene1014_49]